MRSHTLGDQARDEKRPPRFCRGKNAIAAKGNSPSVHCTRRARFAPQRQEHVAWRFPVVLIFMPTSLLDARTQHVVVPNNLSGCFCAGSRRSCFFTGGSPGAFLSPVADRELVSISGSVTRKNSQVKVTSSRAKQLGQALQSHICAITRPAPAGVLMREDHPWRNIEEHQFKRGNVQITKSFFIRAWRFELPLYKYWRDSPAS